jgi:hypothetical protein
MRWPAEGPPQPDAIPAWADDGFGKSGTRNGMRLSWLMGAATASGSGRVPRIGVNGGAEIVLEVGAKKATVPPDASLTGEHDDPHQPPV